MTTKPKSRSRATRASKPPPAHPEAATSQAGAARAALPGGKLGTMVVLLRRPDGASLAQLADATAWKPHSVRGAMAGALKTRGLVVTSEKVDGVRLYRLPPVDEPRS